MPGTDQFYIRNLHHERAEVFGSHKRKPDTSIEADDETHSPDTFNFSRPHAGKRITRARAATMPTILEEPLPTSCEVPLHSDVGVDIWHVTTIQEIQDNEKMWHIARLPKTSAKQCWAQMAVTKKKCRARIIVKW